MEWSVRKRKKVNSDMSGSVRKWKISEYVGREKKEEMIWNKTGKK